MPTAIRRYIRSLGLDAYVVGGAVRDELLGIKHSDEDFLVPGVDQAALRSALEPHGRVEDMEVHGQLVGVRFYPRDREIRRLVPAGIELTPPRAERSTGPGHRDFEIVADRTISIEDDMARRDFTVNAIAKRLETGEIVDPFDGVGDLDRRQLRTVSPESFREDPLRILRGLRLVSQLGFTLPAETEAQMRAEAGGLRHVSGERIGGGLAGRRDGRAVEAAARDPAARCPSDRPRHGRARRGRPRVRGGDRLRPRHGTSAGPARRARLRGRAERGGRGRVAPRAADGAVPRPREARGRRGRWRPRAARRPHRGAHHAPPAVSEHPPAGGRAARRRARVLARRSHRRACSRDASSPRTASAVPATSSATSASTSLPRRWSRGSSSTSRSSSGTSRSSVTRRTGSATWRSTVAT